MILIVIYPRSKSYFQIFFSKISYRIVTLWIHNLKEEIFHLIAYGILGDKCLNSYIKLLDNIKTYSFNNRKIKDTNQRLPLIISCDFEQTIMEAIRYVYPNYEIKLGLRPLSSRLSKPTPKYKLSLYLGV